MGPLALARASRTCNVNSTDFTLPSAVPLRFIGVCLESEDSISLDATEVSRVLGLMSTWQIYPSAYINLALVRTSATRPERLSGWGRPAPLGARWARFSQPAAGTGHKHIHVRHMSDLSDRGSVFRPGYNCVAVAATQRFALLVDGAAYFSAFMRAAERAERSILILAWDLDSRMHLAFDERGSPAASLGEFLNALARRRRRLQVHILNWDYPMVFGTEREFPPLYGLGWKPHRHVHLCYDDTHPVAGSHHQKIVVIDDKVAFVGGLDMTCRRWDTPEHRPGDERRRAAGKPYPPFHDVMAAVDGEAARVLGAIARERWWRATAERLEPVSTGSDPWPDGVESDITDVELAIARTMPPKNGEAAVREVEQLYIDMIARAKRHIYIENQYFTAQRVGAALGARLQEPDGPEIVLVSRLLSHGW